MEDYVEDYTYTNCFWMKSKELYNHSNQQFNEYLRVGEIFEKFGDGLKQCCPFLSNIKKEYQDIAITDSSRHKGIKTIIDYISLISEKIQYLDSEIKAIVVSLKEKKEGFESKKEILDMCNNEQKDYEGKLTELKATQANYEEIINKTIEQYLPSKIKNKETKIKANILKTIEDKKKDYKDKIKVVEQKRVSYMELQGNIFSDLEEFEKDCTEDIKKYILEFIRVINNFKTNITFTESDMKIINSINGNEDNKKFAEEHKSLTTGPKRHLFKEYSQDINRYMENFDFLKKEIKGKQTKEIRKFYNQISQYVTQILADIIKEEPDEIHQSILAKAKLIKESKATLQDYEYINKHFEDKYKDFLNWQIKNNIVNEYQKVGAIWDDRFSYMHTFLGYFNKTRVGNKELNEENFEYLYKLIIKILQLNTKENIDYSLCDLIVILSSTFYTKDPKSSTGKKYITDVVKHTDIMQSQGFWVGLTKYELNEEIQHQKGITDTLDENIPQDKIDNNVAAKMMSVTYNLMQFIIESDTFNKILIDIFKYCKIKGENKENVVMMIEQQLQSETNHNLVINKEALLNLN